MTPLGLTGRMYLSELYHRLYTKDKFFNVKTFVEAAFFLYAQNLYINAFLTGSEVLKNFLNSQVSLPLLTLLPTTPTQNRKTEKLRR